jgi:hypothetical protein
MGWSALHAVAASFDKGRFCALNTTMAYNYNNAPAVGGRIITPIIYDLLSRFVSSRIVQYIMCIHYCTRIFKCRIRYIFYFLFLVCTRLKKKKTRRPSV